MNTSDMNARIAFDLGSSNADVEFESIMLESVVLQFPTSAQSIKNVNTLIYPNPVNKILNIRNEDDFQELTIYNTAGAILVKQKLEPNHNATDLSGLASGIYFVTLSKQSNRHTIKIIKK